MTKILPTGAGQESINLLRDRAMRFERKIVDIDSIDADKSIRNQARLLPVHQDTVELYRAAMENGDVFPPVVLDGRDSKKPLTILDGNHRLFAAKMAGFSSFEALIVRQATDAQTELFTYEANAKHGLPTTVEERVRQGIYLVNLGNTQASVAKALSIPENKLSHGVTLFRTDQRLTKLGFDPNRISSINTRQRLHAVSSDNVLTPLTDLIIKANLTAAEVNDIVRDINQSRSEAKQLEIVGKAQKRYAPIIRSTAGNALSGLPKDVTRLRMAARLLNRLEPDQLAASMKRLDPGLAELVARETVESIAKLVAVSTATKGNA